MYSNLDLSLFQAKSRWLKLCAVGGVALKCVFLSGSDQQFLPTTEFKQELGFRLTGEEWKSSSLLIKAPDSSIFCVGQQLVARWNPTEAFTVAAKRVPFESETVSRFWDWHSLPVGSNRNLNTLAWPEFKTNSQDWGVRQLTTPFQPCQLQHVKWVADQQIYFSGDFGVWHWNGTDSGAAWKKIWLRGAVHQVEMDANGELLLAGAHGLWRLKNERWIQFWPEDDLGRKWADRDALGVCLDSSNRLWIASRAGWSRREMNGDWRFWTGRDGLPMTDGIGLHAGADGSIWFGANPGWVRYDSRLEDLENANPWSYRQGMRWGPADTDRIASLQIDPAGNALALVRSTDGSSDMAGLGLIARVPMTFQEKAAFYEMEIDRYIKRTPWGYTAESTLAVPGERSHLTYNDSDNDGLWTAMYGASQCFAYGVNGSESARRNAEQAFRALEHLQQAPVGSSHEPPTGYVARTVRPVEWPDPNEGRLERDRRTREEDEYLWKVYEPRWPLTADGHWYWKSDTSSDELDGHYFFYPLYYDLVAETEEQKEDARTVVRLLTDHLIDHGFQLIDHDGTVTRWGIYDPESLNHDFNWWNERGLKSLSILSYLAVAHHMTGDPKYNEARDYLINVHGFDTNAMVVKIQMGVGAGNQSDDEMAVMCFYNLMKYTDNAELKAKISYSFYRYWTYLQPERNPFFHFAFAAQGEGSTYTNPWGTYALEPWSGWLNDSVETLVGFPLDRVNWATKNSHRQDLIALSPQQSVDAYEPEWQGAKPRRGYRVDGKVLPVAERHFNHWNTDPWELDYGGSGNVLASGTVYLLPYYMGMYIMNDE